MKKTKQISQETFDEVVKENIEDFGMTPEEAAQDAIAQFESQGVDLSNIIKQIVSVDGGEASVRSAEDALRHLKELIAAIKNASVNNSEAEMEGLLGVFQELQEMLDQLPEMKIIAGRNDAVDPIVSHIASHHASIVQRASTLLVALCTDNTDNQDFLGQSGVEKLVAAVAYDANTPSSSPSTARVLAAIRAACAKHETNKSHFAKAKGIDAVCDHLPRALDDELLSKHIAAVLRVLTINDDPSATFSQAQETIKTLVAKDVITYALNMVKIKSDQPELITAWLAVVKQLATTEEHCKKIYELAGLDLIFQMMQAHDKNAAVVKRCVTVFRNVAAADDVKEYIISSGGVAQILAAMQAHHGDVSLQQHACATLAAIALRSPENSTRIIDLGAARQISLAMRTHRRETALLRQASLAIRNMVARAPELRARILDEDVEDVLREAQQFRGCGDEAYAALRDLGCDIKLSSFGTEVNKRAQFNPVYDESNDLLDVIDEAAEAPFAY